MSDYEPKLIALPGTKLTPQTVLHRALNKLEHIEAVAIVIKWRGGTFDMDWSIMKSSDLCCAAVYLNKKAGEVLVGEAPEAIFPSGEKA